MKMILFIHLLGLFLLCSCNLFIKKDKVKNFIPGVYIAEWSTDFTVSRDTLLIKSPILGASQLYEITRRTFHKYIRSTKPIRPQYKIVHWTAFYNEEQRILTVKDNDRVILFKPDKKEMRMGNLIYKKL